MSESNSINSKLLTFLLILCGFVLVVLMIIAPSFRKAHKTAHANECIKNLPNLRWFHAAKNSRALEHGAKTGDIVTEQEIAPFQRLDSMGRIISCPLGGIYPIGKIGEPPARSLDTTVTPAHVLP